MDRTSLRKTENYRYIDSDDNDKVKELPSKTTITVASDDKTVTIEFPDSYEDKVGGLIVKSDVKDVAGNKMDADHKADGFKPLDAVQVKENSMKVSRADDDVEVELVFDAAVDKVYKENFKFGKANKETIIADSVRINGDKVTFKFNDGANAKAIKACGSSLVVKTDTTGSDKPAAEDKSGKEIKIEDPVQVYDNLIAPELDADEKDGYVGNTAWKVGVEGDKATITIAFDTQIANLKDAYLDDFKFMADNTGDELEVNKVEVEDGNTLKYTFDEDINKLKDVKVITVKADKDNIDVRTEKDLAKNDQKYKPTNDDINGWKLKTGTAINDALKAKAETDLTKAIEEANAKKAGVEKSADGKDIEKTGKWVTEAEMTTFETAIKSATDAKESKDATAKSLNDAKTALDKAVEEFNKAIKDGTKEAAVNDTDSTLKTFAIAGEDVLALSNIDTTGAEKISLISQEIK